VTGSLDNTASAAEQQQLQCIAAAANKEGITLPPLTSLSLTKTTQNAGTEARHAMDMVRVNGPNGTKPLAAMQSHDGTKTLTTGGKYMSYSDQKAAERYFETPAGKPQEVAKGVLEKGRVAPLVDAIMNCIPSSATSGIQQPNNIARLMGSGTPKPT
jgi:hypothetical protein